MSEQVKRYGFIAGVVDGVPVVIEAELRSGRWVLASDYATLQAECERLRREKSARQALSIQLIDEARCLRSELAAIKAQEPVAWSLKLPDGRVTLEKAYPSWIDDGSFGATDAYIATPLYTLPTVNQQMTVAE